ncbi:hypothetical protein [Flavobacterium sp. '19STA2R22 D10 B1']|uniref:hypothetical protein n=1 Tax=Flavobacterium aerium TaxID=3037261 RepID=UPI00278BC2C5|nr:hypothetical protein [Flavobacterium sp. '19STA2R22 D10 B1']
MAEQIQLAAETKTSAKTTNLFLGLLFDAVGMLSYLIPGVAEITDLVWAPISGFILARMYKGTVGKVGGAISFIEELTPGLDIIPTFTLTWIYTYWIKKEK